MFRFTERDVWLANRVKHFHIVDHPGACAIMAIENEKLLMVEQYRPAAGRYMLELPGGTIEVDETPEECAQRELKEETGYQAENWLPMGHIYPTPGYTTEVLYLFWAEGLTAGPQQLPDDEDVQVRWVPLDEVQTMVENGEICDAKTIVGFFKYLHGWQKKPVESVCGSR